MSDFVVSALKYRPSTFRDVVGQEALTTTLLNAIKEDKLSHAYLFCGPRGVGKTSCARIFAKTINCEHRTPEGEACNECSECIAANEQRSYNIFELDAASNNSVDDIRNLIDQVYIAPTTGKYRVYIIDEVHMLSSSAFNAFLKTLEEPPAHAIFILATTEKQKVLPTIISRCQVYDFRRITSDDIARHLEYVAQDKGIKADKEALQLIALSADGGMRDALSMFDQIAGFGNGSVTVEGVRKNLSLLDEDGYFSLLDYITRGNHNKVLQLVDNFLRRGYDTDVVMRGFSNFLRNLLVARTKDTIALVEAPESIKERLSKVSTALKPGLIWNYLKISTAFGSKYKSSSERRLALEVALLKMCELSPTSELKSPAEIAESTTPPKQAQAAPTPAQSQSTIPQPQQAAPPQPAPQQNARQPQWGVPQQQQPQQPAPHQAATQQVPPYHQPIGTAHQPSAQSRYGFSLSTGRRTADQGQQSVAPSANRPKRNNPFTEEQLKGAWTTYRHQPGVDRLIASAMKDHPPLFTPPYSLEMKVFSETEKAEMEKVADHLLQYLRDSLSNDFLALSFRIVNDPREIGPTTPSEKYDYFVKKNKWVERLAEDLDLKPYS
ncbi:MAG: DNA polymerase III subunit gamma/tau [Porphyromonas sp.]|uniref:DNA polymerase III subunit gamma/tau n=1 Tax=Porphyromonas sp. TaxID=1924944 RepID=UPI002A91209C|nr:DNA polymerase III subunit gamma/tau [Porphyromonas sp.]MDD7468213.1 DNA polymerase III subunit gamma/tau [Bacteroidales bacterium]MDY6102765.1 DNA polymerase III subunit gamma/tau [Porphyromonas sp.]